MTIGITGASGHIGSNLTRLLLKRGHTVKVLDYNDSKGIEGLEAERIKGNINDRESLDRLCEGVDVMYHLAAFISIGNDSYDVLYKVNVEGTQNLVAACKKAGVKRFIYFSTIHVLDHHPLDQPLDETRPLITESPQAYERTKSIIEKWIRTQHSDDFEIIIINPTAVVGPYDFKPSLMGQMLVKLYSGKLPFLVPGGYNWVDARDVAEGAANAVTKGRNGESYILSGEWHSLKEIARVIEQATGKKIRNMVLPYWIAYIGVPFIKIWSALTKQKPLYTKESLDIIRQANKNILNDKAQKELDYNPRPFTETIRDTINWFKENNYI